MSETTPPVVAAFDLDGSLTEGGSVWRWLRFLAGSGAVFRAALPLSVPLIVGAVRSGQWADHAKERLFGRLLRDRDLEEVRDESRTFAIRHLEVRGRAKVLERLRWHQAHGHDDENDEDRHADEDPPAPRMRSRRSPARLAQHRPRRRARAFGAPVHVGGPSTALAAGDPDGAAESGSTLKTG